MIRLTLLAFAFAVVVPAGFGQDRIIFEEKAKGLKNQVATGEILSEDPIKVTIKGQLRNRDVPTDEVTDIEYGFEKGIDDFFQARRSERAGKRDEALKSYETALKKVPAAQRFVLAHVRFRIAKLKAELADTGGDRQAAIDELKTFKKDFLESRQILEALELLSKHLLLQGQSADEVIDGLTKLRAKFKDKEVNARCDQMEGRLLVQEARVLLTQKKNDEAQAKYSAAQGKLEGLVGAAKGPALIDLKIAIAECRAGQKNYAEATRDLDTLLSEAQDDGTRAAIHLGRGDCYRFQAIARKDQDGGQNMYKKALWDYLWVDVVYNNDKEQHAKALFHLHEIFTELKDVDHAKECRERFKEDRLAGTSYARLLPPPK